MGKSSKKNKSKTTSKVTKSDLVEKEVEPETEEEIVEKVDPRVLTITIEKLEDMTRKFPKSEIYVEVSHNECSVGQTEQVFVDNLSLISLDAEFEYSYNIASEKNLDALLSHPIYFSLWEKLNTDLDSTTLDFPEIIYGDPSGSSLFSLEEPILGLKEVDKSDDPTTKVRIKSSSKQKGKKEKKVATPKSSTKKTLTSKSSDLKSSKVGKKMSGNTSLEEELVMVGSGNLDLAPLFMGETTISEKILMYPKQVRIDSKMVHDPFLPKLTVHIHLNQPIFNKDEEDKKFYNMFYFTMESIFNIPSIFTEDFDYKIATVFPTENLEFSFVCFENGKFRDEYDFWLNNKFWPNMTHIDNFGGVTKEKISRINSNKLKTDLEINVKEVAEKDSLRVTWNCVKQSWLTEDANALLKKNIIKNRKWPIEILAKPGAKKPGKKGKKENSLTEPETSKKSTKEEKSQTKLDPRGHKMKNTDIHHYMALPDISMLLYPGVTKVRVACEVRSFNIQEYTSQTGMANSLFEPNLVVAAKLEKKQTTFSQSQTELDKQTKKGSKKEKGKGDIKSKKSTDKRKSELKKRTSRYSLRQSWEFEPSYAIYNLHGDPTFIIIEVELKTPFQVRRTIEDLTSELHTIIPRREITIKSPPPIEIATELYDRTIKSIIAELNIEYQKYWKKEKGVCKHISTPVFLRHLKSCGIYEKFITSTERAIALLVKEKYQFSTDHTSNYAHDVYISTVYVYLVNQMNKLLNSTLMCPFSQCDADKTIENNVTLSVREADELDMPWLAERYLLEALARDAKTPEHWFQLAVFYKGQKNVDKSLEAVKEALILDCKFKFGLLLCGTILHYKREVDLAESTLLSLVNYYPDFLFGWVVLYMFYYMEGKTEGADVCMESIKEYEEGADLYLHEVPILVTDPLGWTTDLCDKTGFMKTAMVLIRIFELKLAEMALIFDKMQQTAIHDYYLGVIYFENKEYRQALEYGLSAQRIYGPDYTVNSLIGHCYNRLQKYTEAKDAYNFAIYAYNRPENLHMMYLNLAILYERENNLEKSKKFLLLVCKLSPTPFSWLRLGIIFYKLNDLIEAETCLKESNCLDNRMSETWAYLTLVNLEICNVWEAYQCYNQMLKYPLRDDTLSEEIQEKMKKAMEENNIE